MKQKVSAMIGDIAEGYLQMGDSKESYQELLDDACIAWNIACLNEKERSEELKKLRHALTTQNTDWSSSDVDNHIENIELLIKQKEKKYPKENIQILKGEIQVTGNNMYISVATMRPK